MLQARRRQLQREGDRSSGKPTRLKDGNDEANAQKKRAERLQTS